ncbi:SDR family oxidoreductase [Actinomarinicola tropica]|uniref:SDR family oxidoreductase n=1 Tax=Actinomarinicola tropica TaxID=2789776 RepID=A0A5Q2RL70_9ACTN|nr:SDR family oxidoreductase [Actinomarinicola tropica]QGG96234.1 SDR family oxidoreductase [Actinomarinicola tropica]
MDRGVCVITGGGRGIGAATVRRVAAMGWRPCVSWREDERSATDLAAELGGVAVRADVASEDDVVQLFARARELGPVTAAVANAGIVAPTARLDEMSSDRIRRMFDVNAVGAVLTCREAVRHMSPRHGGAGGSIVAVSSVAAVLGSPGTYVDYAASKGAVDTLVVGLGREVAGEGIRVNGVRPGIIDTEIHADSGQPERAREVGPRLPMGRVGTAEEVADVIAWLLSDDAAYVTATLVDVAGGR